MSGNRNALKMSSKIYSRNQTDLDRIASDSIEKQFAEYISGKRERFDLKALCIHSDLRELKGTELQKRVWRELLKIPFGKTCTYSQLAQKVGKPRAVRAVASAVAKNPLYIVIPCHRIIPKRDKKRVSTLTKASVDIGNYALGRDIKKILLNFEGAILN